MSRRPLSSPRILECRWGVIGIEGQGIVKDAKLFPGGARAWDWRETGTEHRPGIQPADVAELIEHGASTVVLSTGVLQMLGVCPETLQGLRESGWRSRCCRRRRRSRRTTAWSVRTWPSGP